MSYALLSAAALVALCAADTLLAGSQWSAAAWALAAALATVFGALNGAGFGVVIAGLSQLRAARRAAVLAGLGLLAAAYVARQLGGFARLGSAYHAHAVQVLAFSAAGALALAGLTALAVPTPGRPEGLLASGTPRRRMLLAAALCSACAGALFADRTQYVDQYHAGHQALRWASLELLMLALAVAVGGVRRAGPARRGATALFLGCAFAVPLLASAWPRAAGELKLAAYSNALLRLAARTLDFDADGHARLLGGADCDEWNARVHPGAREVPGNGIDDNCLLGDARPQTARTDVPPAASGTAPCDVVLITVDSLRPDHLGLHDPAHGPAGRATSPALDAWAADAVVFERAYAPGGWTSISIASMLRGLYPRRLRWRRHYETSTSRLLRPTELNSLVPGERLQWMFPLAWADPHPTLPGLLRRRGMRTVAVVHDGFSHMLVRGFGLERDFDAYVEAEHTEAATQDLAVVQAVERELTRTPQAQRLFLWAHFFGVHSVNEAHPGIAVYGGTQRDAYDHEVRYFDSLWPRLSAAIARRGTPTVVVVTSDHGEVFADPQRMHGFALGEEDLRVPLIVKAPGWPARRVAQPASTIDLFATLLALTHTPAPSRSDAVDLTPWAHGPARERPRTLFAETWRYAGDARPIVDFVGAFDGRRKVVLDAVEQVYREHDQRRPAARPRLLDRSARDPLLHALQRYVEETGGALDLHD